MEDLRVLTIKEPFATLIKENIKYIETRSWKTNYRGTIYIHSGLKPVGKSLEGRDELKEVCKEMEYSYGKIICKCELEDCIYMTEEYISKIKEKEPMQYLTGRYEVGRYAWVLKNIEVLDEPIEVKGKLGIWHYKKLP